MYTKYMILRAYQSTCAEIKLMILNRNVLSTILQITTVILSLRFTVTMLATSVLQWTRRRKESEQFDRE